MKVPSSGSQRLTGVAGAGEAHGLGTAFGEQKAIELLTEAGFTGITVTPAPGDPLGGVFVATRSAR